MPRPMLEIQTACSLPLRQLLWSVLLTLALTGCTMTPEAFLIATPTSTTQADQEAADQEEAGTTPREQPIQQVPDTDIEAETETEAGIETEARTEIGLESDDPIDPALARALAFAPADTSTLEYNDWSRLKSIAGVDDLSSADPLEARLEFMRNLGTGEQARVASFGSIHFQNHAEIWGWDSTDLAWEASFTGQGPPVFVLRFDDNFDLEPVLRRLTARDFAQTEHTTVHDTITLYSHPMDMSVEWLGTTEFAILNIAVLEGEKIFVLSSAPDSVLNVFEAQAAGMMLADRPDVVSAARALNRPAAAILLPTGCPATDVIAALESWGQEDSLTALRAALEAVAPTGFYTVFGLGYRIDSPEDTQMNAAGVPVGVFVHHYPVAEMAFADLETRRNLAATATSSSTGTPYAELFDVLDATVIEDEAGEDEAGAALTLTVQAIQRSPQLFFDMVYRLDLLFAVCGGF